MSSYDYLIRSGRVIDPANNIDGFMDVAIADGKIAAVEANLEKGQAEQVYDASGKLVVPGLIDIHMHGYNHVTPLGLDTDHYCLGRGVTTAVARILKVMTQLIWSGVADSGPCICGRTTLTISTVML